ncbi:phosphatase PAP2 family protein [Rhodobacteraceae bacterium]|nr:phosphatase PAP2 family protein [Paracoccaceae bacterium]
MSSATDIPTERIGFIAKGDKILFGLICAHVTLAVVLGLTTSFAFNPQMPQLLAMLLGILMPWFVLIRFVHLIYAIGFVEKSAQPLAETISVIKGLAVDFRWQIESVAKFLGLALFIASAGYLKEMITVIQPFAWDTFFAEVDRVLHFGYDPWRLLMPLTGSHAVTTALNIAYHGWFFALFFCVFAACFGRSIPSKVFLVAFVLTFALGGNLIATIFSSAGPVYFERLGLGSDFAPLMAHLYALNDIGRLPALDVQEGLWASYELNSGNAAISAVPSMHVATSVLMALFAFTHSRVLGWCTTVFAATIMIGSVHLGWHYAVDGYMGAAIAAACWWGAKRWLFQAEAKLSRSEASSPSKYLL